MDMQTDSTKDESNSLSIVDIRNAIHIQIRPRQRNFSLPLQASNRVAKVTRTID